MVLLDTGQRSCANLKLSVVVSSDTTTGLRENSQESFRLFRKQAVEIKNLKMEWSEKMKDRYKFKIDEKQAVGLEKEESRLDLLEELN